MSERSPTTDVIGFPNVELLRQAGWSVKHTVGPYCVAFRGADEVVLEWRDGEWRQVGGRGALRAA